jgi:hypothetical protein
VGAHSITNFVDAVLHATNAEMAEHLICGAALRKKPVFANALFLSPHSYDKGGQVIVRLDKENFHSGFSNDELELVMKNTFKLMKGNLRPCQTSASTSSLSQLP